MKITPEIEKRWRGVEVKIRGKRVTEKTGWELGLIIEGRAKNMTPIDTGRLAASITTQARDRGTRPKGVGARSYDVIQKPTDPMMTYVGTPVFYGPYQEFGSIRNAAQPFLRPALAITRGDTLTVFMKNGRLVFREYLRAAA